MSDSPEKDPKQENIWRQVGRYSNLGFILPSAVLVGLLIGYLLDKWLHTHWITLVGLLVGCVAGFTELIREAVKAGKDT